MNNTKNESEIVDQTILEDDADQQDASFDLDPIEVNKLRNSLSRTSLTERKTVKFEAENVDERPEPNEVDEEGKQMVSSERI